MSPIICIALAADASIGRRNVDLAGIFDVDLHAGLSMMLRIILPPGPIRSRILSLESSSCRCAARIAEIFSRGAGNDLVHLVEDVHPPAFAWASASRMICEVMPMTLISICRAVMPSRVPATLKSISP